MVQEKLVSSEKTKNDNNVYHDEPELRFEKFDESWKEYCLEDCVIFLDNERKPLKESDRADKKGKYPYYGASGIIDYIDDYIFDDELILMGEDGANIITRSSRLVFLAKGKFWVNNHAHVFKAKQNFDSYFLAESLERINYEKYNTGTAQPKLNQEVCAKIKFKLPNIDEQKRISIFLQHIDKKIELLEKKLVLCRKTIDSNLRKIYSDLEEYDEIKLKDIVKSYASNLSINKLEKNIGEYPLYGAEGIIKYVDFYEMKSPYISIIKDGAGVGRLNLCNEFSSALGTLQCLIPNEDININFLYFYLKTLNFNKYIVGSTIPHIYFKDYSKERIKVPSLRRQQDIGNYFSLCEKKNNLIKEEIEVLNKFKQGLLQKMFF